MRMLILSIAALIVAGVAGLGLWRLADQRADTAERARLFALQPQDPPRFDTAMVADLPEPAQRFFRFAIADGTPLHTVAEIEMQGQFGMGTRDAPNYVPMRAVQVLAAPHGFIWQMSGGSGLFRISGSDATGWTRFWLAGLAPVARFGGTDDFMRSAFGRYASEAVFWTPAALLPGPSVSWEPVDANTARFTQRWNDLVLAVDLTVDDLGRPVQVEFQRWSNANPDKVFRLQPFGGTLSDYRDFAGFRLPTRVEAGNHFGTVDYFPFFIAEVTAVRFPPPDQAR